VPPNSSCKCMASEMPSWGRSCHSLECCLLQRIQAGGRHLVIVLKCGGHLQSTIRWQVDDVGKFCDQASWQSACNDIDSSDMCALASTAMR
jgi:hypothetical protein